jgi:nucleotide-binding universal stress UspA family protein
MLKDIMVHLDQSESCKGRLEAAISLAKCHGARLTGLYVYTGPRLKDPVQKAEEIRELFQQQTDGSGVDTNWLDVDLGFTAVGVTEMIGYYASFTDLLVVSQPLSANKDKQHSSITSPERLLLGTGRPVLIIPNSGAMPSLGKRVMVAWKAGPKASRALHDAMPLLQAAQHVSMVSIGQSNFNDGENDLLSGYLDLHNVSVSMELVPPGDLSVGDTLLSLVSDDNIDLLVLGVHILTKRGHLDMGEIGSYLLTQMTVPVLLSH